MKHYREIIDLWPTRNALALDVGIKPTSAHAWWQRNSIPKESWKSLVEAAKQRGFNAITYELLAEIAAQHGART